MPTNAQVAVLRAGSDHLSVEDVELPDPGPGQVLVRNLGAGVCHSQLHEIRAQRDQTYLLGHEACGIVVSVGPDVRLVAPGDAVSVSWVPRPGAGTPWRAGAALANGEYASTDEMVFTWGTHSLIDQRYAVRIPPEIASDVAAVLGCAVLTGASAVVRTAKVEPGASVVIWGAGGVGLSAIAAARHAQARPIVAVDVSDEKLSLAYDFGATHTVNAAHTDPVAALLEITAHADGPSGADYVFDCVAQQSTLGTALAAVRRGVLGSSRGGHLVIVGVPAPGVGVSARELLIGQKTVTASLGVPTDIGTEIPLLAQWCEGGDIDLQALVTNRYELQDINRAISDLAGGRVRGRAILTFP
ncbi:zinc-binding dehydrogenase [Mycolicibacterium sp. 050158]|uniref:zinc-binding dehydrogenase n=1 Tax=Mycolicibacterium sp. 050158 TaxID=3090602 RepID=UPI00299F1B3D|nr:zinc-binding dehydrogenase [Mycolicibacterium sp. 050158]MDX1888664.1 zinc-binding dehydrogenase [Mycolicibacterium sp. 050158]